MKRLVLFGILILMMHLTNAQQKNEATIQNKLSATPITGSTALLPYRIHIVKEKPFNATGGSFTRNPERLVDGNTSTSYYTGNGQFDGLYFPTKNIFILDSNYTNFRVRAFTTTGGPGIYLKLFSQNFQDSIVITKAQGTTGYLSWNWIDTNSTKAINFPIRVIEMTIPENQFNITELEFYGNADAGTTPIAYFPESSTAYNTGFRDFFGANINGDEPDSLFTTKLININSATFYNDTAISNVSLGKHRFLMNIFGDNVTAHYRELRDSGIKVYTYLNGTSAANRPVPLPPYAGQPGGIYNYYADGAFFYKNIPYGSDSTNPANWADHARLAAVFAGYFGKNPAANLNGYSVQFTGETPSKGSDLLNGLEIDNEDEAWWHGRGRYTSPQVKIAKLTAAYDSIKSKDANFEVIDGAMSTPDSQFIKGKAYYSFRTRGFNKYPADGLALNYYITSIGGQGINSRGISPEQGRIYEIMTGYYNVIHRYAGNKKLIYRELGWDASTGSTNYSAPDVPGKTRRKTAADFFLRAMHISRLAGVDQIFQYRSRDETNDLASNADFATMGQHTGWYLNRDSSFKRWPLSYGMSTTFDVYNKYSGRPDLVKNGDSTSVWILRDNAVAGYDTVTYTLWKGTVNGTTATQTIYAPAGKTFAFIQKVEMAYDNGVKELGTGKKYGTRTMLAADTSFTITVSETPIAVRVVLINRNIIPNANAGTDLNITLPVNYTTLNGTASNDPDGTIASYSWTRISGPTQVTISNGTASSTAISNLVQGTYGFRLVVTDNNGATDSDTVLVTVNHAPNVAPNANAGTDISITLPVNNTNLNGSASNDADGTITSYSWTRINGPTQVTISNAAAASTAISNLVQGTYGFRLVVTDNNGATDSDTVLVIVNPAPNVAPNANAGTDITITLPVNNTTLNGSASNDPDGTIATYSWTRISGPTQVTIGNASAASTAISNLVQGTYGFRLVVTDNSGATDSDTVLVTVNPAPNVAPNSNAGTDISITLPVNNTNLNGSASNDPDGNIASYSWTRISGPTQVNINNATAANTAISNLVQGTYSFRLQVTDNNGATDSDTVLVTVNPAPNVAPNANAGTDISITLPVNNSTLNGSASNDADGSIASYSWTRISGPTQVTIGNANAANTAISNLVQGTYGFRLVVTDNNGAADSDTVLVTVNAAIPPPNRAPVAIAGDDLTVLMPETSSRLNAGASFDPDGEAIQYSWKQISGPSAALIQTRNASATNIYNLTTGEYRFELEVQDISGGRSTDTIRVEVLDLRSSVEQFTLYPNPATTQLNIRLNSDSMGIARYTIFSMNGHVIKSMQLNKNQFNQHTQVFVAGMKPGVYYLEVMIGTRKRYIQKFIKL